MALLLQIHSLQKSYGLKTLFSQAQFQVQEGEHIGVIGPNGAGKSTLFKILTGMEEYDSGEVIKSNQLSLGYLAQHDTFSLEDSLEEYLATCDPTPIWELKSLGRKLGLSDSFYSKKMKELSGGYRMRAKLLHLLGQKPNLMLLDEPTNYLDLETTLVLEDFLAEYSSAFMLISHDREFLRKTTDHILEVEGGEIVKYNGNLDDYFEQKELLRSQKLAQLASQDEKRKQILDFVSRFGAKATKARQAQSRLKRLEKFEKIEVKSIPIRAQIKIPDPVRSPRTLISLAEADLGYTAKTVIKNCSFQIESSKHYAVIGLNGAGKSTFLKTISGQLSVLKGHYERHPDLKLGYYAQHVAEALDLESNVLEELQSKAHPEITRQEILNMAGSLLFSGDDVYKKIKVLSGGERARVALGQILLQKSSLLILDEPTNHLDFETLEALSQSLQNYKGSLVVVSHDRSFISRVGEHILEINNGALQVYPGTYDEYVWSLEKGVLSDSSIDSGMDNKQKSAHLSSKNEKNSAATKNSFESEADVGMSSYEQRKEWQKQIRSNEKQIKDLEAQMQKLEAELQEYNTKIQEVQGVELQKISQLIGEKQLELTNCESKWMEVSEGLEELRGKF